MSIPSDILVAMESEVASILGASWKRSNYTYQMEKNSAVENNSYAVGIGFQDQVSGTNKSVTLDSQFFVTLTKKYVNRTTDNNQRTAIRSLLDSHEEIYKRFVNKKITLPTKILVVQSVNIEEPEFIDDVMVRVRANFVVKHRVLTVN